MCMQSGEKGKCWPEKNFVEQNFSLASTSLFHLTACTLRITIQSRTHIWLLPFLPARSCFLWRAVTRWCALSGGALDLVKKLFRKRRKAQPERQAAALRAAIERRDVVEGAEAGVAGG